MVQFRGSQQAKWYIAIGLEDEAMNSQINAERQLIPLWTGPAPGAEESGELDTPALSVHLPDPQLATGCGVLVCPGGGYRILASDHEGLQVARYLNRCGIAAFVLRYRLGPTYDTDLSHLDGQRAMRWIRSRAGEFGLDKTRIGMLGFSAGGHLTAAVGTKYDLGDPLSSGPVETESSRPDFLVLAYAVINGVVRGKKAKDYYPTDTRVTSDTPPAFIMHTHGDSIVPANQSLLFYEALRQAGVQSELHVFGYGDHGLGLGVGDSDLFNWPALLVNWIRRCGFLTGKKRLRVSGKVSFGQHIPGMMWITFIPEDSRAPIARAMVIRETKGMYTIPQTEGPTPGPHRMQVTHLSENIPFTGDGSYTLADSVQYEQAVEIKSGLDQDWDIGSVSEYE